VGEQGGGAFVFAPATAFDEALIGHKEADFRAGDDREVLRHLARAWELEVFEEDGVSGGDIGHPFVVLIALLGGRPKQPEGTGGDRDHYLGQDEATEKATPALGVALYKWRANAQNVALCG